MRRRSALALAVLLVLLNLVAVPAFGSGPAVAPSPSPSPSPAVPRVPVLAYFYQWFDAGSWDRAKIDYPAIGRYTSDDPRAIHEQIRQAKAAGIDGFIVSWKSTTKNNRRLRLLMSIARQEQFKLAMIYQGLDFDRHPLPVDRVAADFALFRDSFADDPVFLRMDGKPLTIFSGTWAYSHDDVAKVTEAVRDALLVLSTEKNVQGYQRLADVTDGDAYYWSSVDPDSHPGYPGKLLAMAQAIHADGNLWIAPFSPGFDARLVGGSKNVDRKDGGTLTAQYWAAQQSSPDALGLISWNEFSENTYVEPSEQFGDRYLTVLRQLLTSGPTAGPPPAEVDMGDSSASPGGDGSEFTTNIIGLGAFLIGLLGAVGFIAWYRRRKDPWPPKDHPGGSRQRDAADAVR
jgi:hypothetical protein